MNGHGAGCVCWRCAGMKQVQDRKESEEEAYRQKRRENGDPDWQKSRV